MPPIDWALALAATAAWVVFTTVFAAHAGALWRDEVNSVNTVRGTSLGELWRLEEFESFPLLWLLLLKSWNVAGLGHTDFGLRLFGVLGGLTLPAAMWFAARRLGHRAPLLGLALLAINPEVIRWACSVRAWGLGAALAVVAVVLILESPSVSSRRTLVVSLLVTIASVQCVYQNIVFVLAAAIGGSVAAVRRGGWKAAVPPLGIAMAAGLSLLPYVEVFVRRGQWNMLNQGPLTLTDLADRAEVLFRVERWRRAVVLVRLRQRRSSSGVQAPRRVRYCAGGERRGTRGLLSRLQIPDQFLVLTSGLRP